MLWISPITIWETMKAVMRSNFIASAAALKKERESDLLKSNRQPQLQHKQAGSKKAYRKLVWQRILLENLDLEHIKTCRT